MSEHLTFDEMVNFLDTDVINEVSELLALRINEHISKCDECFNNYSALLELDKQLELLKLNDLSTEQYALIEALLLKSEPSLAGRVNEWIRKLCVSTSKIAFSVVEKKSINVGESIMNDDIYAFDFGHPIPVGARGKSSPGNTSVLIDNENALNKIELWNENSIKVELDAEDYADSPLAALIGNDGVSYISEMKENAGVISCEFRNVTTGVYQLYIQ